MWIAGGNNNNVRNNFFYDNCRRGAMLFGVPDSFVPNCESVFGCDPEGVSTSYDNRFHDNVMGRTPAGKRRPNGIDFWWDDVAGQTGNCWFGNVGARGGEASVTYEPSDIAKHASECESADGHQAPFEGSQQQELIGCLLPSESQPCDWFNTPPRPTKSNFGGRGLPDRWGSSIKTVSPPSAARLAGYGDSDSSSASDPPVREQANTARLANCADWRKSGRRERLRTVRAISEFAGGPVGTAGGRGATLDDDAADQLFEGWCANAFARAFKLYKLYARAAAFGGPR